jgi:hypothetical protein
VTDEQGPARATRIIARIAAVGLVAFLVSCGESTGPDPEQVDRPGDIVFSPAAVRAHVAVLADDSLCGRAAGTPYERRAAIYVRDQFTRSGLEAGAPDYFDVFPLGLVPLRNAASPVATVCHDSAVSLSQNVLGVLQGAGALATQWVVLGAHYDHLGWEVVNGQTVVFNGADDNASGTAVLLETARLLHRWAVSHAALAGNHRSILFAAFGAEEEGLIGSSNLASEAGTPMDSVVAMVNLDMVGRLRGNTLMVEGTGTAPEWPELLAAANADGLAFQFIDDYVNRNDQYPFILRGIPAIHLFTGLHPDYHTPNDDLGLVNAPGLATVGELALAVIWDLATRPARPGGSAPAFRGLADGDRGS